ncbi:MAG: exopolysaccharide biosynthesis protein [Rhodospirillales bacterium]
MNDNPEASTIEKEQLELPPPSTELTSALIRRVVAGLNEKDVSVGYFLIQFRRRSFGGIFLILSALGLIPGISTIAGITMIIPAVQLTLGFRAPLLPRFIRRRRLDVVLIRKLADKVIPWIEGIERVSRPRWFIMTHTVPQSLIGVLCLGLAILVILPLPFSNLPPAIAFLAMSLGMIQRDGLLLCIGVFISLLALALGGFVAFLAINAIKLWIMT